MKREVIAGGRAGRIEIRFGKQDGCGEVRYRREGEEAVELVTRFSAAGVGAGAYSILLGDRSYRVVVDPGSGVIVNGRAVEIEVFDPRDLRAGARGAVTHGRREIAAQMPGKVVRVLAGAGQEVAEGQGLVVVEAMKMQNEMKSPVAGRVAEVRTGVDATVAAGEVLIVIEPLDSGVP